MFVRFNLTKATVAVVLMFTEFFACLGAVAHQFGCETHVVRQRLVLG